MVLIKDFLVNLAALACCGFTLIKVRKSSLSFPLAAHLTTQQPVFSLSSAHFPDRIISSI
jgi:hypothetical protein